ncbi:protein insensitive-like [Ostrinia furnacalis]|uniref:protein insensitive-like n=1 Tax=Ostrinia furnacalis TaxID=93504 RepID=UPI00103A8DB9|nr:protein insensitive-like [Ostrinia furnacalis]
MINWGKFKIATRHLLVAVFGRETLATHDITGKPSPAFTNRAPRGKLDPNLVNDIIQTVVQRCGVSAGLFRASITSKCADEGKLAGYPK